MNKYCPSCLGLLQKETIEPDYHYFCTECGDNCFDFEAIVEVDLHEEKCRRRREVLDKVYDQAVNAMEHFKDQAYDDKFRNDLDYLEWLIESFATITYMF